MNPTLATLLLWTLAQAPPSAPPATPPPPPVPVGPAVVLETSLGRIVIGLYADRSPVSVDNFLKYLKAGHYDGTIFHRVVPGFVIQGGGLDASMTERPTRSAIVNEAKNGIRNSRGTVAMARTSDPNSATSQFFINLKSNHSLDYGIQGAGYAVFGLVLEGLEVVDKIAATPTQDTVPVTPVVLKSARVLPPAKPAATAPSPKP